jgi:hypothetical protein
MSDSEVPTKQELAEIQDNFEMMQPPSAPGDSDNHPMSEVEEAMEAVGIDAVFLAQKLLEEMEAMETKSFFDSKTGNVVESSPKVAWKVRQEARRDAHALLNHWPDKRHALDLGNLSAAMVVMPTEPASLEDWSKAVKKIAPPKEEGS